VSELYYHKGISEYFAVMADPSRQWTIGPTEAICEWFDDMYIPYHAADHPDSESWQRTLREFESCFTSAELAAMRQYHTYFTSIVDRFDVDRQWEIIQRDPQWIHLTAEAQKALAVFNPQT
jgi:hypothetical protein